MPSLPPPKHVYILNPGTSEYVSFHGKEELGLQMGWRLLISWPYNRGIFLAYQGGSIVFTQVFKCEGSRKVSVRVMRCDKDLTGHLWKRDCSMTWSWTRARTEIAYHNPPCRLSGHNQCSFWHKSAPLSCLPPGADSWIGHCDLVKHVMSRTCQHSHISTCAYRPFTLYNPLVPAIRHGDPFYLAAAQDMPKICLNTLLITRLQWPASIFGLSLPSAHRGKSFSSGAFPWICVY